MSVEYRDKSETCGCCGGRIPAGKIRWTKSGECPGHIDGDNGRCGAIVEMLRPSKAWLAKQERLTDAR